VIHGAQSKRDLENHSPERIEKELRKAAVKKMIKDAATIIQAGCRGHLTRKTIKELVSKR